MVTTNIAEETKKKTKRRKRGKYKPNYRENQKKKICESMVDLVHTKFFHYQSGNELTKMSSRH